MLKRKYVIIVALTVVSVLLGSLLYNNLAFGANGSSGSWGAIRFEELTEVEVPAYPDKVVVAQFDWYPQNSSNNVLFSVTPYLQHCNKGGAAHATAFAVKLYDYNGNVWESDLLAFDCYEEWRWTPALPISKLYLDDPYKQEAWYGFPINQPRYNFTVEASGFYNIVHVRNINIVIIVADGMVPNEYYWVPEFPAATMLAIMLPIFMILSLITIVFVKLKKKKQ